jgi:hypothetical protein
MSGEVTPPADSTSWWGKVKKWVKGHWKWLLIVPIFIAVLAGGWVFVRRFLSSPDKAAREAGKEEGKVEVYKEQAAAEDKAAKEAIESADEADKKADAHEAKLKNIESDKKGEPKEGSDAQSVVDVFRNMRRR